MVDWTLGYFNRLTANILLLQREIPNEINVLAAKYAREKGSRQYRFLS